MTILIKNQQRLKRLNSKKIKRAALKILSLLEEPTAELSILFVDDKKMQQLNAVYRGVDRTTDILSFPQVEAGDIKKNLKSKPAKLTGLRLDSQSGQVRIPNSELRNCILGDVVISVPKAATQAKNSGTGFYDELCRLLIHGILHLLGYNHEKSRYRARVMRKKEQEVLNAVKKMDRER